MRGVLVVCLLGLVVTVFATEASAGGCCKGRRAYYVAPAPVPVVAYYPPAYSVAPVAYYPAVYPAYYPAPAPVLGYYPAYAPAAYYPAYYYGW